MVYKAFFFSVAIQVESCLVRIMVLVEWPSILQVLNFVEHVFNRLPDRFNSSKQSFQYALPHGIIF